MCGYKIVNSKNSTFFGFQSMHFVMNQIWQIFIVKTRTFFMDIPFDVHYFVLVNYQALIQTTYIISNSSFTYLMKLLKFQIRFSILLIACLVFILTYIVTPIFFLSRLPVPAFVILNKSLGSTTCCAAHCLSSPVFSVTTNISVCFFWTP